VTVTGVQVVLLHSSEGAWNSGRIKSPSQLAVLAFAVAILSYFSAKLGGAMAPHHAISPLWLGNVFLVSMLLLVPRKFWVPLAAIGFAAFGLYDFQTGVPIGAMAWLGVADTVEVFTAALCLSYFFDGVPKLNSLKALAKFLLIAVILVPFVGALVGALANRGDYWRIWQISFFSEALGYLTLMPAILGWFNNALKWSRKSWAVKLEATTLMAALVLVGYLTFVAEQSSGPPALLYSLVPFLLWAALRFGLTGVSTAGLVLAFLSIWGAVHERGPFNGPDPLSDVLSLQLFLFFAVTPFMVLAALVEERKQAEEGLREGEERLRLANEAGRLGGWEWDAESGRNLWFGETRALLGMSPADRSGSPEDFWERVLPEDQGELRRAVALARKYHTGFDHQFRVVWQDGTERWLRSVGRFYYTPDGEIERMTGILRDITVAKLAMEAVRQREAELSEAQRLAKVGSWQWDAGSGAVSWSEELYRIAGRHQSLPPVSYEEHEQLYSPESWERLRRAVEEALRSGTPYELDVEMVRADGSKKWLIARGEARRNNLGRIVQLVGTVQDITERKQAEKTLHESEERFRLAAEAGKMFAYEWDAASDVILRSAESAKILGIGEAALLTGEQAIARVHTEDRDTLVAAMGALSPEKPDLKVTYRIMRPDGTVKWLERNSRAQFDEQGRILRLVGMVMDVTERKRVEEELRESDEKFRRVFRDAGVGMAIVSPDGRFLACNDAFSDFIGYTEQEMLGMTVRSITHPDDWPRFSQRLGQALDDGGSFRHVEKRCLHKSGKVLCGDCGGTLITDAAGNPQYFIAEVQDITERKRAEEALRESEQRFRLVANTAPVMIWMSETDKLCSFFNQSWLDFTGRSMEQEMGNGWVEGVHPEDLDRCLQIYSDAFDARMEFEMEYRLRRHDGKYRWIIDYGVPRFEADGTFEGYIGSVIDITDRKLSEEFLLELSGRLINAHEEERTRIARELHDDLSQQMALLQIGLEQFEQMVSGLAPSARQQLREIGRRAADVSTDIHNLCHRLHPSKLDTLGLVAAVGSYCHELSKQHGLQIQFVHHDVPGAIPKDVTLCLYRIAQEALWNVVKHSGAQEARLEITRLDDELQLCISDRGAGFDPESLAEKSGIGLVSMRERLRLVGGRLSVISQPSRGTTICANVRLSEASMRGQRDTKVHQATA
jgi:PAS domain S-box-containing protein